MIAAHLARLEAPARLPGIDIARGLAVMGMFAAHLTITTPVVWNVPATWTGLVDGRSSILFATLAGSSLALWSKTSSRGRPLETARGLLMGRAVALWLVGVLLIALAVPVHVILPAYGMLFAVGGALLGLRSRALFVLAASLALVMPFVVATINGAGFGELATGSGWWAVLLGWHYPFLLWSAFLAAGMGAGRLLRASPARHAAGLLAVGALLAILGYGVLGPIGNRAAARGSPDPETAGMGAWFLSILRDEPHSSGVGEAIGSGGFALAVIGVCVLAGMTPLRWMLWPLRAVGSMPLTAYVTHLAAWAVWIAAERARTGAVDPVAGFRALEPFWPMAIGVTIGCALWAALVGRGPLEAGVARLATSVAGRPPNEPTSTRTELTAPHNPEGSGSPPETSSSRQVG